MAERIRHPVPLAAVAHERSGIEAAQVERIVIEQAPGLRISGEEHLETPVEVEAFAEIRGHPSAHAVRRLADHEAPAGRVEAMRAREAGEAGADDQDIRRVILSF